MLSVLPWQERYVSTMDNIQQIADAVQKGLYLIVRASVQQGRTRLTRLRNELYSDSFHAVLAWSCRPAKCQCCAARVTIVVYRWWKSAAISTLDFFDWMESFLYCLCYKKSRHLMVLICTHILLFWLFWRKLKQPGNKNISRMMVDKDQQLSKASHLSKGMNEIRSPKTLTNKLFLVKVQTLSMCFCF